MRGKPGFVDFRHDSLRIIPACAGQTFQTPAPHQPTTGSSPLVRGKRLRPPRTNSSCRIIPACAGQTGLCLSRSHRRSDHPRLCGANTRACPARFPRSGSSPLVRGKPRTRCWSLTISRIIPACAGQTDDVQPVAAEAADHPRLCGANLLLDEFKGGIPGSSPLCGANRSISRCTYQSAGSSPLVRSKHPAHVGHGEITRIIPACAGQTPQRSGMRRSHPDHPRLCGANPLLSPPCACMTGSSPLVRGKRLFDRLVVHVLRIIPACAGQTRLMILLIPGSPDHPRLCGANVVTISSFLLHYGSSPLVRGKLAIRSFALRLERIIPACAGQTPVVAHPLADIADHPRLCGANPMNASPSIANGGSSPLVRGKLAIACARCVRARIIPACAGQTFFCMLS